jgi:hypothetical protein
LLVPLLALLVLLAVMPWIPRLAVCALLANSRPLVVKSPVKCVLQAATPLLVPRLALLLALALAALNSALLEPLARLEIAKRALRANPQLLVVRVPTALVARSPSLGARRVVLAPLDPSALMLLESALSAPLARRRPQALLLASLAPLALSQTSLA